MAAPVLELKLPVRQRLTEVQSIFARAVNFAQTTVAGSTVHLDLSGQTLAVNKLSNLRLLLSCATLRFKLLNGTVRGAALQHPRLFLVICMHAQQNMSLEAHLPCLPCSGGFDWRGHTPCAV
jgi:hypothetical protein